ncbi:hypothetical protein VTG60DRAFT_1662 [Thermothelomyces hinnuleus]
MFPVLETASSPSDDDDDGGGGGGGGGGGRPEVDVLAKRDSWHWDDVRIEKDEFMKPTTSAGYK